MNVKPKTPVCTRCKELLRTTRLVVGGCWLCGECAYELEHRPGHRVTRPRHTEKSAPQDETLFPLEEFNR